MGERESVGKSGEIFKMESNNSRSWKRNNSGCSWSGRGFGVNKEQNDGSKEHGAVEQTASQAASSTARRGVHEASNGMKACFCRGNSGHSASLESVCVIFVINVIILVQRAVDI